ncbi:hypothetical protein [Streptomyces sp. NPDC093089]|uniref:hypothetical protein n=1 Tax=Streptomyces sp. NPDC093089 TaxID=3366024 RepID=UPI00382B2B25
MRGDTNPDVFAREPADRPPRPGQLSKNVQDAQTIAKTSGAVQYVETPKAIRFWETRLVAIKPPKPPRTFDFASRLLPTQERERCLAEWSSFLYDMGDRPRRSRAAYMIQVLLWVGPTMAWIQRMEKRRGHA